MDWVGKSYKDITLRVGRNEMLVAGNMDGRKLQQTKSTERRQTRVRTDIKDSDTNSDIKKEW